MEPSPSKRLRLLLAIFGLTISSFLSDTAAASELLENGNFAEVNPTDNNTPEKWFIPKGDGSVIVERIQDGDRAVMSYRNVSLPSWGNMYQNIDDSTHHLLNKGTILYFSGRYSTDNLHVHEGGFAQISIKFKPVDSGQRREEMTQILEPVANGEWQAFKKELELTQDASSAFVEVTYVNCEGELRVSDLSLKAVTQQDKLTLFSLIKAAPVLDGSLSDESWKGAQIGTGFLSLGTLDKAPIETEVMSCYDQKNVYFGIRCHDLQATSANEREGDAVDILIDPDESGGRFYRVKIESTGKVHSTIQEAGKELPLPMNLTARTKQGLSHWTVELAIPLSELKASFPEDNQRWKFNVARTRQTGSQVLAASWSGQQDVMERPGYLAFYSKADITAAIDTWDATDNENPRMRNPEVSGSEVLTGQPGAKSNLWSYHPETVKLESYKKWGVQGLSHKWSMWSTENAKSAYPEFYRAAMSINKALVAKSLLDDRLGQARKSNSYLSKLLSMTGKMPELESEFNLRALMRKSAEIDNALNDIYQDYGEAFDQNWNIKKLAGLDERSSAISVEIEEILKRTNEKMSALSEIAQKISPWEPTSLQIPISEKRINADGVNDRFVFTLWEVQRYYEANLLLGDFDSIIENMINVSPTTTELSTPGKYSFQYLDNSIESVKEEKKGIKTAFQVIYGLHNYWMLLPPWLVEKSKSDDDILLRSSDGLTGYRLNHWGEPHSSIFTGVNPNNPDALEFAKDYLKNLAAHAAQYKIEWLMVGFENSEYFRAISPGGEEKKEVIRSLGYNKTSREAFRSYLRERYASISDLNAKWNTHYDSFEGIAPPEDKFIKPAALPSGLTYEFERWQRVNHARYLAKIKSFLKAGAPEIPTMNDSSQTMLAGSTYLLFKEDVADIYSYHMNPSSEEAMSVFLNTMARKFKKVLGYTENYIQMYTSPYLNDERLAKRAIRQFFFNMYTRNIRYTTWWTKYYGNSISYIKAYGGGAFNLDYDQTIFRWSTTEYAPMYKRGRQIEAALLDSCSEIPKVAIIQPCSTIFNLAGLNRKPEAVTQMIDSYKLLLGPLNIPNDYIPEEMVLDGRASLADYKVIILPCATYLDRSFSRDLMKWVEEGGVLLAIGSFGMMNQYGSPLSTNDSIFRKIFPEFHNTASGEWQVETDEMTSSDPALVVKNIGKGRLGYLNAPIGAALQQPDLKQSIGRLLEEAVERTATSPDPSLKILVRNTKDGETHLALCNRSVENAVETTVEVKGMFSSALDVVVPGGMPVPFRTSAGKTTTLDISLEPGEWTYLLLKS